MSGNSNINQPIVELIPQVQSYDWGKLGRDGSKVSEFSKNSSSDFNYDHDKPYAELWMGTHPSLPSKILNRSKEEKSLLLKDLISRDPERVLGKRVLEKFGSDLPFLFKVLAIGKALSIQAHPDKRLAERLHSQRPDVYKDPNHKPEMAIAITDFSGFCGFRPMNEISNYLKNVKEFSNLIGTQTTSEFLGSIPSSRDQEGLRPEIISSSGSKSESGSSEEVEKNQGLLKRVFSALMNASNEDVRDQVRGLVKRIEGEGDSFLKVEEKELILRLNQQFPDDVGIFCVFVLNVVNLKPGEGAFLKANEPHAYLTGDIIECMAASDNVVRAGLTPKLRDVPTLVEMLTYSYGPSSSQLMKPTKFKSCKSTTLYDPPIEEFSVLLTILSGGEGEGEEEEIHPAIEGPSILIFTEGNCKIFVGEIDLDVHRIGQIFFVSAGQSLKIVNSSGKRVVCYRAFVEV